MLETELSTQMQEQEEADPEYRDGQNGYKPKALKSSMGEIPISVPQDQNSDFEPQIVPKYKRDISEIEGKVISMYARGMSVRQILDQVRDIYGFDVSEGMVTCQGQAAASGGGCVGAEQYGSGGNDLRVRNLEISDFVTKVAFTEFFEQSRRRTKNEQ